MMKKLNFHKHYKQANLENWVTDATVKSGPQCFTVGYLHLRLNQLTLTTHLTAFYTINKSIKKTDKNEEIRVNTGTKCQKYLNNGCVYIYSPKLSHSSSLQTCLPKWTNVIAIQQQCAWKAYNRNTNSEPLGNILAKCPTNSFNGVLLHNYLCNLY